MSSRTLPVQVLKYELQIPIDASRARVWQAMTEETNAWWLPDFHMVGEDSVVSLEARAGGHLIESKADGGSLLWYTVHMCVPEQSLHLVGFMAPEWGGPATTMLELSLEETDTGSKLVVRDALFGHVTEAAAKSLEEGWDQLFRQGLKEHVED